MESPSDHSPYMVSINSILWKNLFLNDMIHNGYSIFCFLSLYKHVCFFSDIGFRLDKVHQCIGDESKSASDFECPLDGIIKLPSGYKRIDGTTCENGLQLDQPIVRFCQCKFFPLLWINKEMILLYPNQ
jgi:hypothetical protein